MQQFRWRSPRPSTTTARLREHLADRPQRVFLVIPRFSRSLQASFGEDSAPESAIPGPAGARDHWLAFQLLTAPTEERRVRLRTLAWHFRRRLKASRMIGRSQMHDLQHEFGQIDIYLFDQLLRGRITPGMRVVDAGWGHARNLVYLLRGPFDVFGADADARAIAAVRQLAVALAPDLPADNFRVEPLEAMSFPDAFANLVISSAVLHFARDDPHFDA